MVYRKSARKTLGDVDIWGILTCVLWCRFAGLLFIKNAHDTLGVSHLNFNGGGRKQIHANAGQIALRMAECMGLPLFNNSLGGKAGGAEVDGQCKLNVSARI